MNYLVSIQTQSPDVVSIISQYANVIDCSVKLIYNHQTRFGRSFSIDHNTNEIYLLNEAKWPNQFQNVFRVLTPIQSSYKMSRYVELQSPMRHVDIFHIHNNEMYIYMNYAGLAVYSLKGIFLRTIQFSQATSDSICDFVIHNQLLFVTDMHDGQVYTFTLSGQLISRTQRGIINHSARPRFLFSSSDDFLFDCNSSSIRRAPISMRFTPPYLNLIFRSAGLVAVNGRVET